MATTLNRTPSDPNPLKFRFQKGFKPKGITPQLVGQAIEEIRDKYDYVTGELLLKAAKNRRHPLHQWLWRRLTDKQAATKWRLKEANKLIQCTVYVTKGRRQRVYTSVTVVRNEDGRRRRGRAYVPTKEALGYEEEREQVLDEALRDLRSFVERFADYANLKGLVEDVEKVLVKHLKRQSLGRKKA